MTPEERNFQQVFLEYTGRFSLSSEEARQCVALKRAHSLRVYRNARELVRTERFDPAMAALARCAALFHDFGRFEQLKQYGTFRDAVSENHGELGVRYLQSEGVFRGFPPDVQRDLLWAVEHHNDRVLPEAPSERGYVLCSVIRDTDKLDIMGILFHHLEHPVNVQIVWELPDTGGVGTQVPELLVQGINPPHGALETARDFVLAKLFWFRELQYAWTRREFRRREYGRKLRSFLPPGKEIDALFRRYAPETFGEKA